MKRLLILFLVVVVPFGIMSFNVPLRDADHERENGNYHAAIAQYQKALSKKPNKSEKAHIYFQMAECQRILGEWTDAQKNYDKAIKAGYQNDEVYLRRADAKRFQGDYAGALADYQIYQQRVPNDPAGKIGEQSCELSVRWMEQASSCEAPWIVTNENDLNTRDHDFSPAWSDKKHKAIFVSSKRPGQSGSRAACSCRFLFCRRGRGDAGGRFS